MNRAASGIRPLLVCHTLVAGFGLLAVTFACAAGGVATPPSPHTGLRLDPLPTGPTGHDRDTLSAFAQTERPFASSRHPVAFSSAGLEELRIARVGLRGKLGTLTVEQQWLSRPASPATAVFHTPLNERIRRAGDMPASTLSWTSPPQAGWSVGAAYAYGRHQALYEPGDTYMLGIVSYNRGGLTLSGASNGARDWNLLGSYTEGRNTWRLMLTRFEGEDEPMLQFGLDHRYSRALTLFAAFQHDVNDADSAALRGSRSDTAHGIRSGRGIMTGLRYDF